MTHAPAAPAADRAAKLTILLGANGTGKTTLLEGIIARSGQRALVVTPDDIEWRQYEETQLASPADFQYQGVRRHVFDPARRGGTLDRLEYFRRGILVFDDCRAYLRSSTDDRVRQLIIRRRQRMVDVMAVGHGFNEVPPVFFTFASEIILFRTTDNVARRRDCLRDYPRMAAAQARVNRRAAREPHYFEVIRNE